MASGLNKEEKEIIRLVRQARAELYKHNAPAGHGYTIEVELYVTNDNRIATICSSLRTILL